MSTKGGEKRSDVSPGAVREEKTLQVPEIVSFWEARKHLDLWQCAGGETLDMKRKKGEERRLRVSGGREKLEGDVLSQPVYPPKENAEESGET